MSEIHIVRRGGTGAGTRPVEVTVTERGTGRPILLLHGGAGPRSVVGFAELIATENDARVLTPTHPGFSGTSRPDDLSSVAGLAEVYLALLDEMDLTGVTVVGNSVGGWIAAEMAVLGSDRIRDVVLIDAVGVEVPGNPVVDFFALSIDQIAERSYHDPATFFVDPSTLPPPVQAEFAGNRETLKVYGGTAMTDPGLAGRLAAVAVPVLVLWGDSDRIADADYGRAVAAAIPGGRFELITAAGHLPFIEKPAETRAAVWDFITDGKG